MTNIIKKNMLHIKDKFRVMHFQMLCRTFAKQVVPIINNRHKIKKNDIIAFVLVRNEFIRIPFFLEFYRNLGVDHFVFLDNNSSDEIQDYVAQQPDCSLWYTSGSYAQARSGILWTNNLIKKIGSNHWILRLDPDEFLSFPYNDSRNIHDLTHYLTKIGKRALYTLLVDCYSNTTVDETYYNIGDNIFETCPYFDRAGYFFFKPSFARGGARMRLFFPHTPSQAPTLQKFPLVHWSGNPIFYSSTHALGPSKFMNMDNKAPIVTGCLLHFKFISCITDKIKEELERKEHFSGGREYRRYAQINSPNFYNKDISVRYESWRTLHEFNLLSMGEW